MEPNLTAMGCRLPYGIAQYYMPPETISEHALVTPARQAGTRFTNLAHLQQLSRLQCCITWVGIWKGRLLHGGGESIMAGANL